MWYAKTFIPVEKLLEYVKCKKTEDNAFPQRVLAILVNFALDRLMCWCQTYDRAGNLESKQKGASNQFKKLTRNRSSVYYRCISQEINT